MFRRPRPSVFFRDSTSTILTTISAIPLPARLQIAALNAPNDLFLRQVLLGYNPDVGPPPDPSWTPAVGGAIGTNGRVGDDPDGTGVKLSRSGLRANLVQFSNGYPLGIFLND